MNVLPQRWHALFPTDSSVGAALLGRWAEPHRRYHTWAHLGAMLSIVDQHAALVEDADAVRLAVWYHDAIYDPTAGDNEDRSAALAAEQLPDLGVPAERVAEVVRLVRLTAGHRVADGDRNGALLADADLAILAAPASAYREYTAAIREEYAHVHDQMFRLGRAIVLQGLLDLPRLYRIVPEREEWERSARTNLTRELTRLRGPVRRQPRSPAD